MNREHLLLRKIRSAKNRLRDQLQHVTFTILEITPIPWRFSLRNTLFTHFSRLFLGSTAYTQWQAAVDYFDENRTSQIRVIDLQKIPAPKALISKKIAIQVHIYYPDLAPELAKVLANFPASFDLLISTPNPQNEELLRSQFQGMPKLGKMQILITPNRGRDLGPLLYGFGKQLLNYDYFVHIHTKKSSATNDIGNEWRKYLVDGLLNSSQERVVKILNLLEDYGLVYPQKFPLIDVQNCQWGDNLESAAALCEKMQIPAPAPGFIEFPAGSMFWAKTVALKPLLEQPFTSEEFELESGQTDSTIMHAIERSLTHISLSQGYPVALLRYQSAISFYP
jgi:lipopolysaccharide biosynthesis protein